MKHYPMIEGRDFIIDRYRKRPDRDNSPDGMEKVLWTIMAVLALVMAVARVDAMIEKYNYERVPERTTLTYENTKNNPGPVKPLTYNTAGVND